MSESPASRFIRDISAQAAGNYFSMAVRVVRGFALAALLGPARMGVVSTGNLLLSYAAYADFGVTQGLNREIPMDLGRGDVSSAQGWIWYGLVGRVVSGLVVVALTILWVLSPLGASEPLELKWVLCLSAVAALISGVVLVLQTVAKGYSDFVVAAWIPSVFALGNLFFGLLGALVAGPVGVTVGVVVSCFIACIYGWVKIRPRGFARLQPRRFARLARIGVPMALLTFIGFNLENIDQVVILWFLDREALGLYTLVIQAGGLITLLGLSLSNVVGPRLLRAYANSHKMEDISAHTWLPARALSALLPTVVCVAWIAGPLVIQWLLPRYMPSIAPFKIYVAGMFFLSLNLGVSTTLLALGKHALNVPLMLCAIFFNVGVDIVLVARLGLGLNGVALGSLATYALYWMLHTGLVRWYFEKNILTTMRLNLRLGWPGLMVVMFLLAAWAGDTLAAPFTILNVGFLVVALLAGYIQIRSLLPGLRGLGIGNQ